ncbi:hypothetical protein OG756_36485 [Streptomyces sp. NBC_01310]|uniref:hypothetical protein n=1 Tax=Streptomyces sp. NBC_01310 TaxID=2903820 RepID=UPI0035B6120C|nr:hypothetical protein OG756_36485 [Streptomyces sp. NBC_01310]
MSHDDPRAQFLNCTLKTSPERSRLAQGLTGHVRRLDALRSFRQRVTAPYHSS